MSFIACSAPGKLVVLGEYAVLFGFPAAVLAVDRRARVDLRAAEDGCWSVAAPGLQNTRVAFELDGAHGFRWREPATEAAARLVLVEKVVGSLVASSLVDPDSSDPATITLDTSEFFQTTADSAAKLGLGSSSALTVALTEALRLWSSGGSPRPTIDLARFLELHRSFQGGRGSGIDLAASRVGGVLEYRLADSGRAPTASSLQWPEDLHPVFLWTGRSASTASFLARLDREMQMDRGPIEGALAELGRVSTAGVGHLRDGDVTMFLSDVNEFAEATEQLGRATGIPIFSGEHLELRRLARNTGVSYKPSGAGGGDVGIAFTDDPGLAATFSATAANAGFCPLDLQIDPTGVETECSAFES